MTYLTVLYPLRKGQDRPDITWEHAQAGTTIRVRGEGRDDTIEWTDGEGFVVR